MDDANERYERYYQFTPALLVTVIQKTARLRSEINKKIEAFKAKFNHTYNNPLALRIIVILIIKELSKITFLTSITNSFIMVEQI